MFDQESFLHLCKALATNIAADRRCYMVIENALTELKANSEFKAELVDELIQKTLPYLPKPNKKEKENVKGS